MNRVRLWEEGLIYNHKAVDVDGVLFIVVRRLCKQR
jgi:hypothetical protein